MIINYLIPAIAHLHQLYLVAVEHIYLSPTFFASFKTAGFVDLRNMEETDPIFDQFKFKYVNSFIQQCFCIYD